jgi:hypothetical protein
MTVKTMMPASTYLIATAGTNFWQILQKIDAAARKII